jgi:hypothetical protein
LALPSGPLMDHTGNRSMARFHLGAMSENYRIDTSQVTGKPETIPIFPVNLHYRKLETELGAMTRSMFIEITLDYFWYSSSLTFSSQSTTLPFSAS